MQPRGNLLVMRVPICKNYRTWAYDLADVPNSYSPLAWWPNPVADRGANFPAPNQPQSPVTRIQLTGWLDNLTASRRMQTPIDSLPARVPYLILL